ncbi:MAG: Lrp/AsnC family transcriptional regulator [Burkholderiaceae bacterium]
MSIDLKSVNIAVNNCQFGWFFCEIHKKRFLKVPKSQMKIPSLDGKDSLSLDRVDLALMGYLMSHGQGPTKPIAEALGVSESTVRNRMKRLTDQRVLQFAPITNPLRFGFQVWAMLEIQVEPLRLRSVAETLREESAIHLVGIMSGSYDIYAGAVLRTNEELVNLISRRLSQVPGIIRVSSSTMLEVVKRTVSFGFPPEVAEYAERFSGTGRRAGGTQGRRKRS